MSQVLSPGSHLQQQEIIHKMMKELDHGDLKSTYLIAKGYQVQDPTFIETRLTILKFSKFRSAQLSLEDI